MSEPWWKVKGIYQIYPKSFKDTDGDGIGDLKGVIEKLGYLQELGVGAIWLTPIYQSPQRDNGYDISDYYSIYQAFGDMQDFDRLIQEAHGREMKIIMDMVLNHTSTDHEWFQQARSAKESPYRDFYIWRTGKHAGPPTNWLSKFGGSAWKYDGRTGQYYLHLFDETQADLNWENEQVRQKLYEMMRFWLDKGVDGLRLDVINLISKDQRFLDDEHGDGRAFYTDGPRIHDFLHEMNRQVFAPKQAMTVGEMSSTSIHQCVNYTNPAREELDMVFSFHHLKVDYPGGQKWAVADFDFIKLKRILSRWQEEMHRGGGWNALFWSNHDQPRVVSRFGDDTRYRQESAKMLATTIHMMQGTPFIYQGEEIGMTNPNFQRIDQYRDVETVNIHQALKDQGVEEEQILAILRQKSRDNARTPMQWDATPQAGFTTGAPWLGVAPNYAEVNVEQALGDRNSIFYHYQRLLELRRENAIIRHGDYQLILEEHPRVFAYLRQHGDERLLVLSNFYGETAQLELPPEVQSDGAKVEILIANYQDSPALSAKMVLRSYESIVYRLT